LICIPSFRLLKESEEGRNPFQQGSFIKENSERIRNSQLERFSSGSHHFQTDENELKAKRGYFISQYGDLETYLYIAILEDSKDYKIGISTFHYIFETTNHRRRQKSFSNCSIVNFYFCS
jgi:hypothetical protein